MLELTLHALWFAFLVVLLEFSTQVDTPFWIILAMAITYVAILVYDEDLIGKLKGGIRWARNKFSSAR